MKKTPDFVPFGGLEIQEPLFSKARVAVLPLPYENAPSYGEGSAQGPFHILDASTQLEFFDEEKLVEWAAIGIHTLPPPEISPNPQTAVSQMEAAAAPVLAAGKKLLGLGGDHAVTIGLVRGARKIFPGLGVLQIDAHLDLRDTWNGSRFNHACVMRRLHDDQVPFIQVGIRSFSVEEARLVQQQGWRPFYAHQITSGGDTWMEEAISRLPEHVFLTLDLDGLDPSAVPGTGTPEPGGLTYRQVVSLISRLGQSRKVVAADITELAAFEGSQVSEFTAARLAQKIILYCF